MVRYFINQEDTANKFWQVEVAGKRQIVKFGRIGTAGRETVKEFAGEAECLKDTEKLIAQKIKKGYTEVESYGNVPEKAVPTVPDTPEARFWDAIKRSNKRGNKNWRTYDIDEHLEALTKLLSKWDKQQLVEFETVLQQSLGKLYKASILELNTIIEDPFTKDGDTVTFKGFISDDSFIYFRCWLILKGKEFFDEILDDINAINNGKYSFDIGDVWAEGLLYVTDEAYAVKHDNEDESEIRDAVHEAHPEINYDSPARVMDREPANGAELQKMYPELVRIMVDLR